MIPADSRYANNSLSVVNTPRGAQQVVDVPIPEDTSYAFSYYTVEEGVTPDWLGHTETGDGSKWWLVANANPEIIDWYDLKVGTVIRIPLV